MAIVLIVTIILGTFLLLSSVRVVEESQRMVVFRRGRFLSIAEPGLVLLVPIFDKGLKVDLAEEVPGWQDLSQEQLEKEIRELSEMEEGI